ncbi:MAG: hypothetical protein GYA22_00130 [Bacteroidales bacterium]|nr:hypothetical protein [Bacteroidales bacterium]
MIFIREATEADNEALQQLNREAPMRGNLTIRVERIPDFFAINRRIGPFKTMLAESGNRIAGVLTIARHPAVLQGKVQEIGVIRDIKIHPDFRGSTALYRLLYTFLQYALSQKWDILYATALKGNAKVISLMGGRAGLPFLVPAGHFVQYNLLPKRRYRGTTRYQILTEEPSADLLSFFNNWYARYSFGPLLSAESLQDTVILSAWKNNVRHASIVLQDVSGFRQNVVEDWSFATGLVIRLWQFFHLFLPLPLPPRKGKPLRTLYVRYFAASNPTTDALDPLITRARKMAWDGRFTFLAAGLHSRDPLRRIFRKHPFIPATLNAFILSLQDNNAQAKRIAENILFNDFTLI